MESKEKKMKRENKQKIIGKINLVGALIGLFIVALGLFRLLNFDMKNLIFILIFIGLILLIWRFLLEVKK